MGKRVAVIGCGIMGRAIVRGLIDSEWTRKEDIIATNPHQEQVDSLKQEFGIKACIPNEEAAKDADIIILGVKPQVIKAALKDMRGVIRKDQLVISVAAGIPIRFIEYYTGDAPVIRAMPNLGVTVKTGATAIACGAHAEDADAAVAREIFGAVGIVEEVHESLMDAVTGLSGTGPMYVFYMIEALADGGVKMGLPRDVATRLAMQTVRGSARLAQESGVHPAALKDKVSSPGGTSITALHVLRKQNFAGILMDAVEAATQRSAELGE